MTRERFHPGELLVHRGGMLMLDAIVDWGEEFICARIQVSAAMPFCDERGAPGWLGLEWIAQAAGAWFGIRQMEHGEPVEVGFLLGAREYKGPDYFEPGKVYAASRIVLFEQETGMAVVDGTVSTSPGGEGRLAASRVKLFKPPDPGVFMDYRTDTA